MLEQTSLLELADLSALSRNPVPIRGLGPINKHCTHSDECKTRFFLDAISRGKTIQKIDTDRNAYPIKASLQKSKLLHGTRELLSRGGDREETSDVEAKDIELICSPIICSFVMLDGIVMMSWRDPVFRICLNGTTPWHE